jgi:hypothetical protein
MMKQKKAVRLVQIIAGFLIFFSIFFQKVVIGETSYSIWDIVFKINKTNFNAKNVDAFLGMYMLIPVLFINMLYLIRSVLLMKKKNTKCFAFLPMLDTIVYTIVLSIDIQLYLVINIMMFALDYFLVLWLEERDKITQEYMESKIRDKKERDEKKRIKYFPGKYPIEFWSIIKKNTAYGKNGHTVLKAGCFISAASIYIMLAIYQLIKQIHEQEDFLSQNGLVQIFKETGILVIVLLILLMKMIISCYIREQKKASGLFTVLGMRTSTVYLIFTVELSINTLLSGLFGMIIGGSTSYILKSFLQSSLINSGINIKLGSALNSQIIGISIASYVIVVILALGLNQENIINLACCMDVNNKVDREKRSKRYGFLLLCVGLFFIALAIKWYSFRSWAESMYIHIFSVLGFGSILTGGIIVYLNRLERSRENYYHKLMVRLPLYSRFWKSLWNYFYFSIIHFFVLAVFAVQLGGSIMKQNLGELYPYDIVCTAYDADLGKLNELAQKHGAIETVYPMFRMTSVYGSDKLYSWNGRRPVQWPQGQHVAISVSGYQRLKSALGKTPEKLNLSGKQIHVVYQQDLSVKAHTIDWDTSRIDKRLRIGQPLSFYNTLDIDNVFPVWKIKSEERDILTGAFRQGMNENLIVCDDNYFEKMYQQIVSYNEKQWNEREEADFTQWHYYSSYHTENMTEGPTNLICLTVKNENYNGLLKDIAFLDTKYQYDRMWDDSIHLFYGKTQMMADTGSEIFFKTLVYLFAAILLSILGLFQYYVKLKSELKEMHWQNNFLEQIGMRDRERKKMLTGQIKSFVFLPLLNTVWLSIIFMYLTAKARLYNAAQLKAFIQGVLVIYFFYFVIWYAWYIWMKKWVWRHVQ